MIRAVLPPVLGLCCLCMAYAQPGIHVRSDGNVGINASDPQNTLVITGNPAALRLGPQNAGSSPISGILIFDENEANTLDDLQFCGMALRYSNALEALEILGGCDSEGGESPLPLMTIDRDGHVGIGAAPDTFMLQVAGSVRSEEVIVETGWADYVFEEGYHLRPLLDVEAYIRDHGHLPDIPSASEIESRGLGIGRISSSFMQKIEELTLYAIDQEKQLSDQRQQISELRTLVNDLSNELNMLKQVPDNQ